MTKISYLNHSNYLICFKTRGWYVFEEVIRNEIYPVKIRIVDMVYLISNITQNECNFFYLQEMKIIHLKLFFTYLKRNER